MAGRSHLHSVRALLWLVAAWWLPLAGLPASAVVPPRHHDFCSNREAGQTAAQAAVVCFAGGTSAQEEFVRGSAGTFPIQTRAPTVMSVRGSDMGGGVGGLLYSLRKDGGGVWQPAVNSYDARGDVIGQTNAAKTVTFAATYKAYGKWDLSGGATTPDRQKANTKEEDPTGFLNEGFRYRDLETGVVLTRDPAGFVDGPNLYTYVQQNPWSKYDSEGLFWSAVITAGFAAYDTYQFATGQTSGKEYAAAMALNGAAFLADMATAGQGGAAARARLEADGIPINDAANGVGLPKNTKVSNPDGKAVH